MKSGVAAPAPPPSYAYDCKHKSNDMVYPPLLIADPPPMPIGMEQWRASVGSNNAARARVFSKCSSHTCSSPSYLNQFFTYILAFISSLKRSATDKGKMIHVCVHVYMYVCIYVCMYVRMYVYVCTYVL